MKKIKAQLLDDNYLANDEFVELDMSIESKINWEIAS